jgi:hypothetical protein
MLKMKDKSDIILDIVESLLSGTNEEAKSIILNEYPHKTENTEKRLYTTKQKMSQFLKDGFVDRYTGKRLINPGVLKVISNYFPEDFPFHSHWKMSQTHIAYWELIPTIDHIYPIARGGADNEDNWATTSMKNNLIKNHYTMDELDWKLFPRGSIEEWDGLTGLFIDLVERDDSLLKDNYIKNWYVVSKKYTV